MIDRSLLDKIKKCFALAGSSNENEAAAALAKARKLMEAHGITDEQLKLAEMAEATARASRNMRPPQWENFLSAAVCDALQVHAILSASGDRIFIGRGPSSEIAAYAFGCLFRKLKAARKAYIQTHLKRCKPGRKRQRADIFCQAWARAVHSKIAALGVPQADEEPFNTYLDEFYPGLITITSRNASIQGRGAWNDYHRGAEAGQEVDLHSAVNEPAKTKVLA